MPAQTVITSTTQVFLEIFDIANDLVLLKNGTVSLIIQANALNFGLLAEAEQDAIIYGYAGLLNSLNYPIQIVIRSQTKDVTSYLQKLIEKEEETLNPLRKNQIKRYRQFITELIQERNVLDKRFYVVIPATGVELGVTTPQSVIPGVKSPDIESYDKTTIYERARNILEPKRDHIISQFGRLGMYSRQLTTQEIIQLFYSAYNPEASEGQKITNTEQYTTAVVGGDGQNTAENLAANRQLQPENLKSSTPGIDNQNQTTV